MATRLGVSTSTVRRFEGSALHPTKNADGVNLFDAAEVTALAMKLMERRGQPKPLPPRNANTPAPPPRTADEVMAAVFARFEARYSLAEIVVAEKVAASTVRKWFHEYQLGLVEGEIYSPGGVVPTDFYDRHVNEDELQQLLQSLPVGSRTRISIGHCYLNSDNRRVIVERGGWTVQTPLELAAIHHRFGRYTAMRVTAYDLDAPGLLWEVFIGNPG